jgi:STE24 endopeptidase
MTQAGMLWWLYTWIAWIGFQLLILALYPTLIAPLFNKFQPLSDADLKERVERLLERCEFAAKGLFVMDGSRRSSHGNAYFTGFGAARRIVFFDTLLARLQPEEVEAVLAHELGHFKLRHIAKRIVIYFGISLAVLAFLGWLTDQAWFYQGFGIDPSMAEAMPLTSLLLFFLVFPLVSKWFRAISSHFSRLHEFEADRYAAQHASARELASALIKLHRDNASTLTPDPIYSAVNDSHPSAAQRIARLAA